MTQSINVQPAGGGSPQNVTFFQPAAAGSPDPGCMTVQGISGGTPVPVSLTGAATAANQSSEITQLTNANTSLASILTYLGTVLTDLSSLATAAKQDTGNTSLATIATNTNSVATASNQATANTSLATIATNTTGVATAANQSTANTSLATIATNTTGLNNACKQFTGVPTVTAGTYTGHCIGGIQTITNAMAENAGNGKLRDFAIYDKSANNLPLEVSFFKTSPTGTYADNGAISPASGDWALHLGTFALNNWIAIGSGSVCTVTPDLDLFSGASSQNVYFVIQSPGLPTYNTGDIGYTASIEQH